MNKSIQRACTIEHEQTYVVINSNNSMFNFNALMYCKYISIAMSVRYRR